MLINFSNHPSTIWSHEQIEAAKQFGSVKDVAFPAVPPEANEQEIASMADKYAEELKQHISAEKDGSAVHIMGEMTLTFAIVQRLCQHGITCLASTTRREVTFDKDGNKVATFRFIQFRKYEL